MKYKNKKTKGYDSKKEAKRAWQLEQLEHNGLIKSLQKQVTYSIVINNIKVCKYVADFTYTTKGGEYVVEDVKSEFTAKLPVYRLKKKLMKAVYGIEINEYC